MSRITLAACILALFFVSAFVRASESDELREGAKAIMKESIELSSRGEHKEAAVLKRKALAMLEEAEHLEQHSRLDKRNPEITQLRRLLEKLRLEEERLEQAGEIENRDERIADIRREAEAIEDKLRHLSRQSHGHARGPHDDLARRLEHMRAAVEHLNQAGLHEIAEQVVGRAEIAERELHERHGSREANVLDKVMMQLQEIRREVGRLRDEVSELKEKR
jgi:hypothetical protein